jgi:hypothetical protein
LSLEPTCLEQTTGNVSTFFVAMIAAMNMGRTARIFFSETVRSTSAERQGWHFSGRMEGCRTCSPIPQAQPRRRQDIRQQKIPVQLMKLLICKLSNSITVTAAPLRAPYAHAFAGECGIARECCGSGAVQTAFSTRPPRGWLAATSGGALRRLITCR